MTADEIRNTPITVTADGLDDPQKLAIGCAGLLQEIAAQFAEANQAHKPRWVNLGTYSPLLIDATQVVGLGLGQVVGGSGFLPAVLIYLRSTAKPIPITDRDHDEVRGLLGIGEDWMNPIARPPTAGRYMTESDYAEAMAIIDVARKLATDEGLMSTSTGFARENLNKLDTLFDSWDLLPF